MAHFAIRVSMPGNVSQESPLIFPACTNHKLTDATLRVQRCVGRLRSKAFVVMVVSVEYKIGACFVQILPKPGCLRIAAMQPGRKSRCVPESQCAFATVFPQIFLQPALLG